MAAAAEALWCDLAQVPHLLVGGMSGGGKSVFLRQLLTWLVLAHQPSSLRLLVLDFKSGVELVRFGKLPHALHEAVTETQDAELALHHPHGGGIRGRAPGRACAARSPSAGREHSGSGAPF